MKDKNKDTVRISVWLSEAEKEKLERSAEICGLSQSEFVRQLCKGKTPKPQPTKKFWKLLEALYGVHSGFKECAKYEPSALNVCKEIECLILDLQEVETGSPQSLLCGEKEHPRIVEFSTLAAETMKGV